MSAQIQRDHLTEALLAMLDETFDQFRGYYIDQGASMFETLATISAAEASIPVGGKCATLAAQVKHTAFYLDVLATAIQTKTYGEVDWGKIWRETSAVDEAEWEAIKANLRQRCDRLKAVINDIDDWSSFERIGGAIATIAHTAYHLGEIRQALCTIKRAA